MLTSAKISQYLEDVKIWTIVNNRSTITKYLTCSKLAYRNSRTLDASVGRWTLDTGLWTLDSWLWTLDAGLWTLDTRIWMLDPGRWTLDPERWTALDTIVDCISTKSEASFWFSLIKLLKILWVRIS